MLVSKLTIKEQYHRGIESTSGAAVEVGAENASLLFNHRNKRRRQNARKRN